MTTDNLEQLNADTKISEWNSSYERKENYLFYPKEEVVKFLNRFVRKKIGTNQFRDILDFSKPIRGLDLGCGIGRQTLLMEEFGIEASGIDISEKAIQMAKLIALESAHKNLASRFSTIDGKKLTFNDNYFDITICESVLDSMHFDIAKTLMQEIDRVTCNLVFMSLIAPDQSIHHKEFEGEEVVNTIHEQSTIQSYFQLSKIQKLIQNTGFKIHWCHLITDENILTTEKSCRYYVVLKK